MKLLAAALLFGIAVAVPAEAQIYSWRDPSGSLVLSTNKARTDGLANVTTYAVPAPYATPGTTLMRTTTKPAMPSGTSRYDDVIAKQATEHGVSVDLVRAVIQAESGFNPMALSPKGAMGLMQLMPGTARELGVNDPFQPADNIRGGVTYLKRLLSRFDQNVELALAAYNAGPGAVEKYRAIPPYRETREYVRKITSKPGVTTLVAPPAPPSPPPTVVYKWTAMVNGQPTLRYSNTPPQDVAYEVVGRR